MTGSKFIERGDGMKEIHQFFEDLKKAWAEIKKLLSSICTAKNEIEAEKDMRSTWCLELDNRKPSQVIDRKPQFAIQKII